jgi:hypothetical protein
VILGTAFLLVLASVVLTGGRLLALAEIRLRRTWVIFAALAAQILIISVFPGGASWVHDAVHLGSYGLAGWFVWSNRHIPGVLICGVGGSMNLAAIIANGGVMPASPSALRSAGIGQATGEFANSAAVANPRLQALGDVFAIPAAWPIPVANVFSAGDVVLVAGIAIGLHWMCGSRLVRWAQRGTGVTVRRFEALRTGATQCLVRLEAVTRPGDAVTALVVDDGGRAHRVAPLPAEIGAPVSGFPVPRRWLDGPRPAFAIELASGRTHDLPRPSGDSYRPHP